MLNAALQLGGERTFPPATYHHFTVPTSTRHWERSNELYSHSSPEKYTMACTVVLRKSTHGRITLQLRQRGGWALFSVLPLLTTKEHPCNDYSDSMPSKQLIGQTVCTTEPPVTLKSRSDGTQHSERHKASTNVLRKKFARFNFTLRASYEILTRCVLLNQHVVD